MSRDLKSSYSCKINDELCFLNISCLFVFAVSVCVCVCARVFVCACVCVCVCEGAWVGVLVRNVNVKEKATQHQVVSSLMQHTHSLKTHQHSLTN
jgi:hypothetical protein